MRRKLSILSGAAPLGALLALVLANPAVATPAAAVGGAKPVREFVSGSVVVKLAGASRAHTVRLARGVSVAAATARLRADERVAYASPDYVARASVMTLGTGFAIPNDIGSLSGLSSNSGGDGWGAKQWNFLPYQAVPGAPLATSPGGINAPGAWRNLIDAGAPGGKGVTVAVVDSGIAYRGSKDGAFRRSPDFSAKQFVPGYDFVDGDSRPLDENGHGTHVAGTIAERTDNAIGLTGLAYGVKLMPIRVLNRRGEGRSSKIAAGIRYAVRHGAQVINMSFNFACGRRVPVVDEALREAYLKGVVTVASVGNRYSETCAAPPATGPHVIGVGGTTEGGCLGSYSLTGAAVDVLAPGGGEAVAECASVASSPIYQVTLMPRSLRQFGMPPIYVGTSMAAAHVSALAALVLASDVIQVGPRPTLVARSVARRIKRTARGLGLPAEKQGAGLIDAAAATDASRPLFPQIKPTK